MLALDDPGVANWLDPGGAPQGVAAWRWVKTDTAPVPTVKKVPFTEARQYLPAETKFMSPEQRSAWRAQRRKDVRRLYGV